MLVWSLSGVVIIAMRDKNPTRKIKGEGEGIGNDAGVLHVTDVF